MKQKSTAAKKKVAKKSTAAKKKLPKRAHAKKSLPKSTLKKGTAKKGVPKGFAAAASVRYRPVCITCDERLGSYMSSESAAEDIATKHKRDNPGHITDIEEKG